MKQLATAGMPDAESKFGWGRGNWLLGITLFLGACQILGACQTAPPENRREPPSDLASVSVFSGIGFSGITRVTIFADDRVKTTATDMNGKAAPARWLAPVAGRYTRARAIADKLIAGWTATDDPGACLDYGSDGIEIATAGVVKTVAATCPDPRMQAAMGKIYASITPR